jgi:small-conductance mechanosensitive channel
VIASCGHEFAIRFAETNAYSGAVERPHSIPGGFVQRLRVLAVILFVLCGALAALTPAPIHAQEQAQQSRPVGAETERQAKKLDLPQLVEQVEQATKEIESGLVTDVRLEHWQARLPEIRQRALEIGQTAQEKVASRRTLLEALGPAPKDGTEPPAVEAQRSKLTSTVEDLESRAKRADVLAAQSQQLLRTVSERSRARFAGKLTVRGPSPIDPRTWLKVGPQLQEALSRLANGLKAVVTKEANGQRAIRVLVISAVIAAFAAGVAMLLRRWLRRRFLHKRDPAPSYMRCLWVAGLDTAFYLVVPAMVLGLVVAYMGSVGLLQGLLQPIVGTAAFSVAFFFTARGLTRAVLAVDAPRWRILPLTDSGAARLSRLLTLAAAIFAIDILLVRTGRAIDSGEALRAMHQLGFGILITLLLARLIRRDIWTDPESETQSRYDSLRGWLVLGVGVFGLLTVVPVLFGYIELSRFFATRTVLSVLLASLLLLLHALVREAITACFGAVRTGSPAAGDQMASMLQFWLGAALDIFVLGAGVLLALPLWGLPWQELWTWIVSAAAGFTIGEIRISPLDLVLAVLMFAAILGITRALQRALDTRILSRTRLDVGVRDSLRTFTGYLGLVLAALIGLSTAGLDFSNLAIVAGALSVGIGFGLQAIVNNFVSGLILLFERPVKVGDWIVVGGHEGTVRRIRVRSTEIDTFDRSTVIVPNSDLISNAITNWTHGNRVCRVIVPVRVPYGSDTQHVHDLLMQCAQQNPYVTSAPMPYVLFKHFGESALEFELRVYARDTDYYLDVLSDLHFAVDKALREAGIAIPFPQRDLHIRTTGETTTRPRPGDGADQPGPALGRDAPEGDPD